jgi:Protein of unknown function (DUF4232)
VTRAAASGSRVAGKVTPMAVPHLRATTVSAVLAAVGLLAAACTAGQPVSAGSSASDVANRSTGQASPSATGQHPPPAGPTRSATSQPSPLPSASPASAPVAAGPAPCTASGLRISIGASNGAAGSLYYPLDFTNVSGSACTMYGYPGVSFATGPGGSTVGGPAVRNPTFRKALVTLDPGVTAHAPLKVANAENYSAALCKPVTAHWLEIFPPASYVADFVAFTAVTCTGTIPSGSTLGIYVVLPGTSGP